MNCQSGSDRQPGSDRRGRTETDFWLTTPSERSHGLPRKVMARRKVLRSPP